MLSVKQQPPQEPPQQPQQLHIYTPPEPAITSIKQGPRQGPKYSKKVAIIAKIYTDNKLFIACQGVPAYGIAILNSREDLS